MFFHALIFAGSRGSCLNTRLQAECSNHLLRDLANVNAMKQTWVIAILDFTWFQSKIAPKTAVWKGFVCKFLQLISVWKLFNLYPFTLILSLTYIQYCVARCIVEQGYKFGFLYEDSSGQYMVTTTGPDDSGNARFLQCFLDEISRCWTLAEKNLVEASKQSPIHGEFRT